MNLGHTITMLRKQKDISQQDLAMQIGISGTSLCKIEAGNTQPKHATLEQIAYILSVPLPVIYLLSIEYADIPVNKLKIFELLEPAIRQLLLQLC